MPGVVNTVFRPRIPLFSTNLVHPLLITTEPSAMTFQIAHRIRAKYELHRFRLLCQPLTATTTLNKSKPQRRFPTLPCRKIVRLRGSRAGKMRGFDAGLYQRCIHPGHGRRAKQPNRGRSDSLNDGPIRVQRLMSIIS